MASVVWPASQPTATPSFSELVFDRTGTERAHEQTRRVQKPAVFKGE